MRSLELVGGGVDDARQLLQQAAAHLDALLPPAAAEDIVDLVGTDTDSDKKRPAPDDGPEQTQTKVARSELAVAGATATSPVSSGAAPASASCQGETQVVDLNYYKNDSLDDSSQVLTLLVPDATVANIMLHVLNLLSKF